MSPAITVWVIVPPISTSATCDYVTLVNSLSRCNCVVAFGKNAGASDGNRFIFQNVQQLEDTTALIRELLAQTVDSKHSWFHISNSYA